MFINDLKEVLLFLRDNKKSIPYPNMWDVPGGHVEANESPHECIVREMEEEMGIQLVEFLLFAVVELDDRVEYVYWKEENLDIKGIDLTEGQCLRWFSREDARKTKLAYGFNDIVEDFFEKAPFLTLP